MKKIKLKNHPTLFGIMILLVGAVLSGVMIHYLFEVKKEYKFQVYSDENNWTIVYEDTKGRLASEIYIIQSELAKQVFKLAWNDSIKVNSIPVEFKYNKTFMSPRRTFDIKGTAYKWGKINWKIDELDSTDIKNIYDKFVNQLKTGTY